MPANISAETLSPITHNQNPVITTDLLAQLYGAKVKNISDNFLNNISRFVAGKHYFKIEKSELREFKNRPEAIGLVGKNARSLILWTERGAARHAKMLETDQAWEVFERLEDCYFNQSEHKPTIPALDLMNFDIYQAVRKGKVAFVKHYRAGELMTAEDAMALLKARGWLVIPREELAGKLMDL